MRFERMNNLGATRNGNPFWYKNFRDSYLAEVTDNKSNANLDIGEIEIIPPAEGQAEILVCTAIIKSNIGQIPCRVYPSPKSDECLELHAPEHILIDPRVAAQVLRYVESLCVTL